MTIRSSFRFLFGFSVAIGVFGPIALFACKEDKASADAFACERSYAVCPSGVASSDDVTACARALEGLCGRIMEQYLACIPGKCDDAGAVDRADSTCTALLDQYRSCATADAGVGDAQ